MTSGRTPSLPRRKRRFGYPWPEQHALGAEPEPALGRHLCGFAGTARAVVDLRKVLARLRPGSRACDAYAALRVSRISFASRRPKFLSAKIAGRCWERGRAFPSSQL
jgi:hypothetical protein